MAEKIMKLWKLLEGKKTYFLMVLGVLYTVARLWNNEINLDQAMEAVLTFLGIGTLRSGISKAGK